MMELHGCVEQIAWPVVMTGLPAELMALQRQLDATQWWPGHELLARQRRQLHALLGHAARTVPFHAERLRAAGVDAQAPLTEESWLRVPILTRRELQQAGDRASSTAVPQTHGRVTLAASGGSTGVPVRIGKTALAGLMWNAIHVREEIWHRENPHGTLARIGSFPHGITPDQMAAMHTTSGLRLPDWGPPTNLLWQTGEAALVSHLMPIPEQMTFLQRFDPDYLLTNPSSLRLLLSHIRDRPLRLSRLRAIWTLSEAVDDTLRAACQEVLGCRIVHNYSAAEVGYMALQCPSHEHFHVQSEVLRLEVLDETGRPCLPGQIGRVVVTPLHNYATPLLRYEIGDEAVLGAVCPCGRGLPVLTRIVGRILDYVTLPSGVQRRVDTGHYAISRIPAVREYQLVQRTRERIDLMLVTARPLTIEEEAAVQAALRKGVGPEFAFDLHYRDQLERTASGKLRPFLSALPDAANC